MRPKFLAAIIIVILAILAILFWQQRARNRTPISESNGSASVTSETSGSRGSTNEIPATISYVTNKLNDREKANEIRQAIESRNQPINVYAKVVDQDDQPLSGAKVKGTVRQTKVIVPAPWGAADHLIPVEKDTDSAGRFEVHDANGVSFAVESVQKDGYEAEPFTKTYAASVGSLERPLIFKMWKTNIHEKLITGDKKFEIVPDGRAYFINLSDGTISESNKGDLKVWIKRPEKIAYGEKYDCSCGMAAVNGGLLAEEN